MQSVAEASQSLLASQLFPPECSRPIAEPVTWDWQWKRSAGDTEPEIAKLTEMARAARDFLTDVATGRPPRWLTFIGHPGCGKTHLADRIRWWLRAHGEKHYKNTTFSEIPAALRDYTAGYSYAQEGSIFAKWSHLLERARDGDYEPLRRAARDHYKIIDDLGVDSFDRDAQATVFATQKIAELLDRRLGKWTVLTTNFTRRDLATRFDPRISSRLLRGDNIIIDCGNLRDFWLRRERPGASHLG